MNTKNPFRVEYGSIYTNAGRMIDHMGVVIDKNGGLSKYGSLTGNNNIRDYYNDITKKYRDNGLCDVADDLLLIEFDRYDGVLSIDEICTFCNYMVQTSANGSSIIEMLNMNEEEIHNKLGWLKSYGY